MAAIHGKNGTVSFTSLTFELMSWSVDATADTAEATAMQATNGAKIYLAGFIDWTATCEVLTPGAGVGLAAIGTTAVLTLVPASAAGKDYVGNAICTGVGVASDKDGIVTSTLSFQGSGQLVEAAV